MADFTDVRIIFFLAAYPSVTVLGAYGLRCVSRNPGPILGLGLLVIPFIPASNLFFLVGTTIGERLMYPCTVGRSILLVAVASQKRCLGLPAHICRAGLVILLLVVYVLPLLLAYQSLALGALRVLVCPGVPWACVAAAATPCLPVPSAKYTWLRHSCIFLVAEHGNIR